MGEEQSCTTSCATKDMTDMKGQAGDVILPACHCGEGNCHISQAPATVPQTVSLQAPVAAVAIQSVAAVVIQPKLGIRATPLVLPSGSSHFLSVQHYFSNAPPKV